MPAGFIESDAEEAALGWLETLGILSGMDRRSRFGIDGGERGDQVSAIRFCSTGCIGALTRLYPGLPTAAVFDGYRRLLRVEAPNLLARNRGSGSPPQPTPQRMATASPRPFSAETGRGQHEAGLICPS
jgi:hypothetical protein